jgi:hypothetical protein
MNYDRVFNQLDKQRIETLKYLKSAIK